MDDQAYTWDHNGNLTGDGSRTLAYDAANRLISVTVGALTTEFEYDGLGNRLSQTVAGTTTSYVLDVAGGLPQACPEPAEGSSSKPRAARPIAT